MLDVVIMDDDMPFLDAKLCQNNVDAGSFKIGNKENFCAMLNEVTPSV